MRHVRNLGIARTGTYCTELVDLVSFCATIERGMQAAVPSFLCVLCRLNWTTSYESQPAADMGKLFSLPACLLLRIRSDGRPTSGVRAFLP